MKSLGYSQQAKTRKHHLPAYLPDFIAESVLDIDFARLKKIGITHLLIDLDQTIKHKRADEIEQEFVQYLYEARADFGVKEIFIVTNNRRNLQKFSDLLGAKIFQPYKVKGRTVRKPSRQFFESILKSAKIKPHKAVMIGDKLAFDTVGANRAGIYTIYVNPLGQDYWYDRLLLTRRRDKRKLRSAKLKGGLFSVAGTELHLKEALRQVGLDVQKVQKFNVDARGSEPFIAKAGKKKVFVKLITRKSNFFDWVFKFFHRLLFGRLEDSLPFVSPRQAVEHQAYIAGLVHKAGVRTPKIIGVVDLHDHRHGLVTNFIDGKPIDSKQPKKLTDEVLMDIWQQVGKLHQAHIAHRDLRAANVLLDNKKKVWLIDFDFATTAATVKNLQKDNVELLVSLASIVGVKKSVKYASTVLTRRDFRQLKPLLRYKTLSYSTRLEARQRKGLINSLRDYVDVLAVAIDR
ncbi:MAG: HAD-IA family hydrolase [Candidatus Saccharimonadales bacterium]